MLKIFSNKIPPYTKDFFCQDGFGNVFKNLNLNSAIRDLRSLAFRGIFKIHVGSIGFKMSYDSFPFSVNTLSPNV